MTGGLKATLTWKDIPDAVIEGVKAALEDNDGMRWNLIARAFISMNFSQRNLEAHIRDPETHPLPSIKIMDTPLHRMVYRLEEKE